METKYEKTQEYKELISKHSLDEWGVWMVKGEDPNPGYTGVHHRPVLGFFRVPYGR
tara:strand:- start:1504 stop:1671 length:168 start_codon:yes stop_codon:yes gene_type:complete